jgi:hypothetical protein
VQTRDITCDLAELIDITEFVLTGLTRNCPVSHHPLVERIFVPKIEPSHWLAEAEIRKRRKKKNSELSHHTLVERNFAPKFIYCMRLNEINLTNKISRRSKFPTAMGDRVYINERVHYSSGRQTFEGILEESNYIIQGPKGGC